MVVVMQCRNYEDWEKPYPESRYNMFISVSALMNMSVAWAQHGHGKFDALDTGFVSKYMHARSAMFSGRMNELDDDGILMAVAQCVHCRPCGA